MSSKLLRIMSRALKLLLRICHVADVKKKNSRFSETLKISPQFEKRTALTLHCRTVLTHGGQVLTSPPFIYSELGVW
jgi:hypothetical protein